MMDLLILESKYKYTPKKVLDIGCNVGQFYKHARQYWPQAKFFLVDGNESVREDLVALDVPFQIMLLADTVKKVNLYKNSKNPKCTGTSIYRENTEHYSDELVVIEEKMTTTLDIVFPDISFGLIKLDTQGSEIDILNGGLKLMLEADFIIMETSLVEWNLNSPKEDEVIQYMDHHGYMADSVIGQHYLNGNLFQQDILFRNGFK